MATDKPLINPYKYRSDCYNSRIIRARRILVIRDDKLGDVILSTPVLESLRKKFPYAYIAILVRPATYEAVRENPFVDAVLVDDKPGWGGIWNLGRKIAAGKFDTVLNLFNSARGTVAAYMARVPRRVGPRSRWPLIFLTHKILQKRSRCEKHEADYNLDLAAFIGAEPVRNTTVCIDKTTQTNVDALFSELGIKENIPLVGFHPGGGGTSLRWKVESYRELVKNLTRSRKIQFFVTHGIGEEGMVRKISEASSAVFFHPRDFGILEMAEIIRRCKVFVSASTGPMHLASAVKTPVVALFCPVFVCSEKRWGPYSVPYRLLCPDVPSCDKCVEKECPYYDCMERIPVGKVASAVQELLIHKQRKLTAEDAESAEK